MVGVPIAVILTVIGGLTLTFDFSSETTTIGDTITTTIINEAMKSGDIQTIIDKYSLGVICNLDPIPVNFFAKCVDWEP